MRLLIALILGAFFASPVTSQEGDTPWQATVTGQIQALRSGDGAGALSFAGAAFQEIYDEGNRFALDVARSGYGPIIGSRSHSFGPFRELGPDRVVQAVNLIASDGQLYEAVYQLANEPDVGWRVQGVVLRRVEGLST